MKKFFVKKIAIFGSGSGSNAENICNYFSSSTQIEVVLICTNKKDAKIINRAKKLGVPVEIITKKTLFNFSAFSLILKKYRVDYIVLAGFLLKIPNELVLEYEKKILNIHPSLLPKYGGKGMYGLNVHRSVLKNKERVSGITIHFVNKDYDKGEVVLQIMCPVHKEDCVGSLAEKIQKLEHMYYPKTIESIILK